jgi:hypothetical protein
LGRREALAARLQGGVSLDALTSLALQYFGGLDGVDKAALRDRMVCDRLATNASGKLPPALRIPDKRLRCAYRRWNTLGERRRQSGRDTRSYIPKARSSGLITDRKTPSRASSRWMYVRWHDDRRPYVYLSLKKSV